MSDDMSPTLLTQPRCRWNTVAGRCGAKARPYPGGQRCDEHSPWGLTGEPEPLTPNDIARRKEQAHAAPEA